MDLPLDHLRTLAAVIDAGSLEGAAKALHITPSAVSQRIRSLEERAGSVLLRRTRPVSVTEAGATVLRAARQIERITLDVAAELTHESAGGSRLSLVVNADSLATWFVPALARAALETGAHFEVLRADETISTERLRSGEAIAAVTATPEAVPGCASVPLGVDRYHAVAHPDFVRTYFPDGIDAAALATAPVIDFDHHDAFQRRFIERAGGANTDPPRHFIPSSAEFAHAIELQMGWGMVPHLQCADALRDGRLVTLSANATIELPLYWQRWNLKLPALEALSAIILDEASRALGQPNSTAHTAEE